MDEHNAATKMERDQEKRVHRTLQIVCGRPKLEGSLLRLQRRIWAQKKSDHVTNAIAETWRLAVITLKGRWTANLTQILSHGAR